MLKLFNKTTNQLISGELQPAESFLDRGIGLLKFKKIEPEYILWIKKCNSIHTFFMRFSIDCVFVDTNLVIKSLHQEVKPWRLIWPQWGATSVLEMSAGAIERWQLKKGDQLYVVS